ncbi:MAG: hypothetical protein QS748_13140 [Candidatus Endonucleobacter bathymodioli]|uniref:Uncharacterized protein n=1 Tax=Candidatus Endonucleibacter bathymodioli TaxID=539814 RepID=A0AA90SNH0_9GAMM|nr:hypothetical protein [Candidatus Endonucleobacter bathymodioli]
MPFGEIMVWKNLKQRSLADSMRVDHVAVKELDSVHELIDWVRLEGEIKSLFFKCIDTLRSICRLTVQFLLVFQCLHALSRHTGTLMLCFEHLPYSDDVRQSK